MLPGDLNQDSRLSVTDVVLLRSAIVAKVNDEETISIGDMDGDGTVTVSDVILLREAIVSVYYPPVLSPLSDEKEYEIVCDLALWWYDLLKDTDLFTDYTEPQLMSYCLSLSQIRRYYGTYNGYDVVLINDPRSEGWTMLYNYVVGDVTFLFGSTPTYLYAYSNGTFIELADAYEQGLISKQDVETMSWYHVHRQYIQYE